MEIHAPVDWTQFFRRHAALSSRPTFEALARGSDRRRERFSRALSDGTSANLCRAVLVAVAATGPKAVITYPEVLTALRGVLQGDVPQKRDVLAAMSYISQLARDYASGDLVVDYSADTESFYVADPFFANFLRWAVRIVT